MPRTPDSRRVRSITLTAWQANIAAGTETAMATHTFQDDVRVIGAQVSAISTITDAQLNADGRVHTKSEVSKQGAMGMPGAILVAEAFAGWTAAILIGEMTKRENIIFPEGYGLDFDDGETIYLHAFIEVVGVDGHSVHEAIVYYVER